MKKKPVAIEWAHLDTKEEIQQAHEVWNKILEHIQQKFIGGVPGADKKGHSIVVSFRAMPAQADMDSGLMEMLPPGSFKNKSRFHSCIHAVGCYVMMQLLQERSLGKPEKLDGLNQMLDCMNIMGMAQRRSDLHTDVRKLQEDVGESELETKISFLQALTKLDMITDEVVK